MSIARVRIGRIRIKAPGRKMLNVVPFEWPADDDVVALTAYIDEQARSGRVDAIGIAATFRDGCVTSAFHIGRKLFPLMGVVATLDERLRQKAVA